MLPVSEFVRNFMKRPFSDAAGDLGMPGPACLRRRLSRRVCRAIPGSEAISGGVREQAFLPTLGAFAKSRSSSGAETPGMLRVCNTFRVWGLSFRTGRTVVCVWLVVVIRNDFIVIGGYAPPNPAVRDRKAARPPTPPPAFVRPAELGRLFRAFIRHAAGLPVVFNGTFACLGRSIVSASLNTEVQCGPWTQTRGAAPRVVLEMLRHTSRGSWSRNYHAVP